MNAKIDVKETGQKKVINGYNASELVMTIQMDSPREAQMGKMQMEMDMWLSSDPPGVKEMRAFYQKNMSRFPWAAMSGGRATPSMQAAMAEMQRKMAEMNGVNVMQVMKMKAAGGGGAPAMPQMTPEQMAQMKAAMASGCRRRADRARHRRSRRWLACRPCKAAALRAPDRAR